ncbi:MAG: BrnA antitoxin family protein, partial [Burkholderiales bacterium]|nr:BrnA antitoxin family protein [Burkholderiales bacterium]
HLLKPRRGRPPKAARKRAINIRLSQEVLEHFRASGPGWQTRVDEVLKSHVARRARRAPAQRRVARRQARA